MDYADTPYVPSAEETVKHRQLVLSEDSTSIRNQWKVESALAQAGTSRGRRASVFVDSRSSYAPNEGSGGVTGKLKTGRYYLQNVKSQNIVYLPDSNQGTSPRAGGTLDDETKNGVVSLYSRLLPHTYGC